VFDPTETDSLLPPRVIRRLNYTIRALRRLPPGPRVALRARVDEYPILEEIFALPDETDVVTWVAQEKKDQAARYVLKEVLRSLQRDYQSARNPRPRSSLPAAVQPFYDDFLQSWTSVERDDLFPASEAEWDQRDRLQEILRQVRTVRPQYHPPGRRRPSGELVALTDDLLRLPAGVDPVRWLEANRSEFAAYTFVRDVIAAISPSPIPIDYSKRHSLDEKLSLSDTIEFQLKEFAHGPQGFALDGTLQLHSQPGDILQGNTHVLRWWDGFDSVEDDAGYAYPSRLFDPTILDGFGATWQIKMEFYPAISPGARMLAFSATPAFLVGIAIGESGAISIPEVRLRTIAWQFDISHGMLRDN
jgi:hypothetical protein